MAHDRRRSGRTAVAFIAAAAVGVVLATAVLSLEVEGGIVGAVLWIVIGLVVGAVFTAILEGPQALVRLIRNDQTR